MRMGILAATTIAVCSGGVSAGATAQMPPAEPRLMRAFEDSLWITSRERRQAAFANLLAADYRGVYEDGVHDKARELATFPDVKIVSYEFHDFTGRTLGAGAYAVTYRATVRGTWKKFRLDGDYWCSSVWKYDNGKWQTILHTETKVR